MRLLTFLFLQLAVLSTPLDYLLQASAWWVALKAGNSPTIVSIWSVPDRQLSSSVPGRRPQPNTFLEDDRNTRMSYPRAEQPVNLLRSPHWGRYRVINCRLKPHTAHCMSEWHRFEFCIAMAWCWFSWRNLTLVKIWHYILIDYNTT